MLKALMEYVGAENPEILNGFSIVQSDVEDGSNCRGYYLCLGRHDFFLVPRQSLPSPNPVAIEDPVFSAARVEKERAFKRILVVSYRAIDYIVKSVVDHELLTIVLKPGTLKRYKHLDLSEPQNQPLPKLQMINILCGARENVLTELLVAFKASHMFFTFEIHTEEIVKEGTLVGKAKNVINVTNANESALSQELDIVTKFWRSASSKAPERCFIQGYTFYRANDYEENQKSGSTKKQYDKPFKQKQQQLELGQAKTNARVDCATLHVQQLEPSGERLMSVQSICERAVREICSHVVDWRLRSRPGFYQKRMNLTGDPASWTCWIMRIRTLKGKTTNTLDPQENRPYEFRHITVIACRRNFIPPTMQSYCDFLITHISQYQDFSENEEEEIAQLCCDTLSPEGRAFERDDLVVQATADALLLDNPSYFWYESELRVRPRAHEKAREFCRALFQLLLDESSLWFPNQKVQYQALVRDWDAQYVAQSSTSRKVGLNEYQQRRGQEKVRQLKPGLDQNSTFLHDDLENDPSDPAAKIFRLAEQIEMDAPGLDPETDSNKHDWIAWRIRVWRYLAYCADGAMFKEALDLEQLTKAWKMTTDKTIKKTIARVLDKFIHLRQAGEGYKQDEFHQKAGSERLMNSCAFNERVMVRLLKTGYIQQTLSTHSLSLYPRFLVRLLSRADEPTNIGSTSLLSTLSSAGMGDTYDPSENISHAVLKCLVVQSSSSPSPIPSVSAASPTSPSTSEEDKANDISLNILVPALIRLFMNHPEDDRLRTFVIAILVNFSRNNYSVKANILAGGFAREIVKLLKSKDDDLVRHACSLLTNLTKTTDFRMTIYRGNTKSTLLDLIRKNPVTAVVTNLPDSDRYRAPKIISQACQVIGNLAIDAQIRADILKDDELQHDADGHFAIPTMVRTLADLISKNDYLATFRNIPKDRQELDDVRASALFALKNLSISTAPASNEEPSSRKVNTKSALGRYASKDFLKILRDKEVKDRNLIDYLLRLLYSLSYEPRVASKLQAERIQDGLALRKQDFANLCLQIQNKIVSQQKTATAEVQAEEAVIPSAPAYSAGVGLQGGILRQSRFKKSANPEAE